MTATARERTAWSSIVAGAIAGLGGGVLFGAMMGMMNMLPMVGMLVGVESALVGAVVHMVISAFVGAGFGLIVSQMSHYALGTALVGGVVYGVFWWVLGALILMPLMLGMTQMVLAIGAAQWLSLVGHLVYGVATGLLLLYLRQRV